jgi:hypothetical protein
LVKKNFLEKSLVKNLTGERKSFRKKLGQKYRKDFKNHFLDVIKIL